MKSLSANYKTHVAHIDGDGGGGGGGIVASVETIKAVYGMVG